MTTKTTELFMDEVELVHAEMENGVLVCLPRFPPEVENPVPNRLRRDSPI